jgi:hypothetical protein
MITDRTESWPASDVGGALVFAAYGLAFAAAGTWFITRRDIR